jgi:hypothetical protein
LELRSCARQVASWGIAYLDRDLIDRILERQAEVLEVLGLLPAVTVQVEEDELWCRITFQSPTQYTRYSVPLMGKAPADAPAGIAGTWVPFQTHAAATLAMMAGALETLADFVEHLSRYQAPELSLAEREFLLLLLSLNATGPTIACASGEAARGAPKGVLGNTEDSRASSAAEVRRRLKALGLISTKPRVGTWLTPTGLTVAERYAHPATAE